MLPAPADFGLSAGTNLAVTPELSTFAVDANDVSYTSVSGVWDDPTVNGDSNISNFQNLNDFEPNLQTGVPSGNDMASFSAASSGTATGVVLFMDPHEPQCQKHSRQSVYGVFAKKDKLERDCDRTPDYQC